MLNNNYFKSTIANNLKTNNAKATRVGFTKHEDGNKPQIKAEKVDYITVKLEDFTKAIILSDYHNNPVLAKAANSMLVLDCSTVIKGPKSVKQLKKTVFNFIIKLDTGKNQFEFNFDVGGDEVMADGSKLYENLKTTSTRHGYIYEFDNVGLASNLIVDVPSNIYKHYGHTNLNKAFSALQKKAKALEATLN